MNTIDNNNEKDFNEIEINILIHDLFDGNFPQSNTEETFFKNLKK